MIVFLKSDGSVAYQSDVNINLGSNKANKLTVIAPFAPSSVMTVYITLPNGETLDPLFMDNGGKATEELEGYSIDGKNLSVWEREIDSDMTGISGTLKIQLYINNDGATFTSSLIIAEVNVGVKNVEIPTPTDEDVYQQILNYLYDSTTYINQQMTEAEKSKDKAVEARDKAVEARDKAVESENSAKKYLEETEKAIADANVTQIRDKFDNIDYILAQFGAVVSAEDNEVAFSKLIPKNSDLYAYINSFSGVRYQNLIDFDNVPTSVDDLTIAKTNTGLLFNSTYGTDAYGLLPLKRPAGRDFEGTFYLTVREPLPENVSIDVWTGKAGYDSIVCTLDSNNLVKSFYGYGDITLQVKITGALKDCEIAPCLSYGKPMYYGEKATDLNSIKEITDYVEVWNGKKYELGSIDSSGANKEQTPDVRSDFITVPDNTDIIDIERSNDSSTEITVFYYDADKVYIDDSDVTDLEGIAMVSGAKYIRLRLERSTGVKLFAKTVKLYNNGDGSLIWDGTVELGSLITSGDRTTTCGIRTDYIPVLSRTCSYVLNDYDGTISIYSYNSSKTFISKQSVNKTANELTLPSGTAYVRLLLSKAYGYNGEVLVYKGKTESYSLAKLKDLLFDPNYAYGSGFDAGTCNKVDFENGYYEQWCDGNGNILTDNNGYPITESVKTTIPNSVMIDIFGGLDPLVKITENKAITLENDNDNPVPSVITYNIIQEA